jgi:hypothetical protein
MVSVFESIAVDRGFKPGQRMKETLAINKSLSNLGNVIMAIGNKVCTKKKHRYSDLYLAKYLNIRVKMIEIL